MRVRVATDGERRHLGDRYADWGYRGGIGPDDVVLVAEDDDAAVGIVRQTWEHGVLMLRGMYVAPEWRGRGVGSALLRAFVARIDADASTRGRACFGIPFAHLERFYAQGSFRFIPAAEAPPFLQARAASYGREGHRVAIMRRDPTDPLPGEQAG